MSMNFAIGMNIFDGAGIGNANACGDVDEYFCRQPRILNI